jgi:tetratricopeptide (TPR) repeat protein
VLALLLSAVVIALLLVPKSPISLIGRRAVGHVPDPDTSAMEPRVTQLIATARAAVLADLDSPQRWGQLGAALDAHGLVEAAEVAYRQAHRLDGDEFRWAYNLAILADLMGRDIEEVDDRFEKAAALGPDYAPLACRWGAARAQRGRHEAAAEAYARSLSVDGDFAFAHRGFGTTLLALGEIERGVHHLERAAELLPRDAITSTALAQAYRQAGQPDLAARVADRSRGFPEDLNLPDPVRGEVAAFGISSPVCSARASANMEAGRYAEAIPDLLIVEEVRPDDPYVQIRLTIAYMRTGEIETGLAHARNAVRIKPDFDEAHVQLGRLLMARGDLAAAIDHLERAVEIAPDNAVAHAKLATALGRRGRVGESLRSFERAARLGDLSAESYTNWALALGQNGEWLVAADRCEDAVAADPNYAKAYYVLGYVKQQLGRTSEAVEHYRDAIAVDRDYVEAHVKLGSALEQLGDPRGAIAAYRRVLQIDPDHPIAQHLARLEAAVP